MRKKRKAVKQRLVYIIGAIALITLVLSLFLFLYSFERIYYESKTQERLLEEWESLMHELTDSQIEELSLDSLIHNPPTTISETISISEQGMSNSPLIDSSSQKDSPSPAIHVIGKLTIPAIKGKWPLVEGVSNADLAKGVGHYTGSANPGETGNAIYAGHREMGLKQLGKLEIGEEIIIDTLQGQFIYEVTDTRVVDQHDRSVHVESDEALLTIITCYPFDYIGAAPDRFILTASLIP